MLFAEDQGQIPGWLMLIFGSGGTGLVGAVGVLLFKLLEWRKTDRREDRQREDQEEETALQRLEKVMKMREDDCDRRIKELTARVEALERNRDLKQIERDRLLDNLAQYKARLKYLEFVARQNNLKLSDWDKPDTAVGLPAVDDDPPTPLPKE